MTNEFGLGKNGNLGKIDFTKIKSGLKKEDLTNISNIASIFNLIDSDGNGVLSAEEINKLKEDLNNVDKNSDGILSDSELAKLKDKNGKNIGKKIARELFTLFNLINEKMEKQGVENVSYDGYAEEVIYANGQREYLSPDYSEKYTNNSFEQNHSNGITSKGSLSDNGSTYYVVCDEAGNLLNEDIRTVDGETVTTENTYVINGTKTKEITTKVGDTIIKKETITTENGVEKKIIKDFINNITETYENNQIKKREIPGIYSIEYDEEGYKYTTHSENTKRSEYYNYEADRYVYIYEESRLDDGSYSKIISSLETDGKVKTTGYINDKEQYQLKEAGNGLFYCAEYDGQGNTKTVVQYGESAADIARTFDISVEELLTLNEGKWTGSRKNPIFKVGTEIKIPKIIEAGDVRLASRNSAEIELAEYEAYLEEQKRQKEYDTLIAENQRIYDLYKEAQDRKIQKRKAAYDTVKNINDHFVVKTSTGFWENTTEYGYKTGHTQAILDVGPDNVVEVLESIPDLLDRMDNRSQDWTTYNTSSNYRKFRHLRDQLVIRAKKAGVPNDTIEYYSRNTSNYQGLPKDHCHDVLYGLCSIINTYETLFIAEDIAKAKNEPLTADERKMLTDMYLNQVKSADEAFRAQVDSDGWCGNLADEWAECFWNSDNTQWDVEDDLGEAYAICEKLAACKNEKEFKTEFKNFFGIEPDIVLLKSFKTRSQNIAQYENLQKELDWRTKYKEVFCRTNTKPLVRKGTTLCTNPEQFGLFHRLLRTNSHAGTVDYYGTGKINYHEDLKLLEKAIDDLGGFEAVCEEFKKDYIVPADFNYTTYYKSNSFIQTVERLYTAHLNDPINDIKKRQQEILKKSGQNSYEAMLRDYENTSTALFGTQKNIMSRVRQYCISQQEGAGTVKNVINTSAAVGAVVVSVASGATGLPILATAIAAITPATVEITELMTCNNAAKYEGSRWEYTKENADWKSICTNLAVTAVGFVAGTVTAVLSSSLEASLKFAMMTLSDIGVGATSQFVVEGKITIDGIVYNAAFSVMGNSIGLKSIKKNTTNPETTTSSQIPKQLIKQTEELQKPVAKQDVDVVVPKPHDLQAESINANMIIEESTPQAQTLEGATTKTSSTTNNIQESVYTYLKDNYPTRKIVEYTYKTTAGKIHKLYAPENITQKQLNELIFTDFNKKSLKTTTKNFKNLSEKTQNKLANSLQDLFKKNNKNVQDNLDRLLYIVSNEEQLIKIINDPELLKNYNNRINELKPYLTNSQMRGLLGLADIDPVKYQSLKTELLNGSDKNRTVNLKRLLTSYTNGQDWLKIMETPESLNKYLSNVEELGQYLTNNDFIHTKGILDIAATDPVKYQRIKDSGILDLIKEGKLNAQCIKKLGVNGDLSADMYNDLALVKSGKSIVPEFPAGTDMKIAFEQSKTGDAVEIGDKMYLNNGEKLIEWNMTKEKYLELFPPVERFATMQGALGDCYLVQTLGDAMHNPKARVEFLQSFSLEGNDVIVTVKAYEDYNGSHTFKNSEIILPTNGKHIIGCKGIQMFEQTYARVALREKTHGVVYPDATPINNVMERGHGGHGAVAYADIFGKSLIDDIDPSNKGYFNALSRGTNQLPYEFPNGMIKWVSLKGQKPGAKLTLVKQFVEKNPNISVYLKDFGDGTLESLLPYLTKDDSFLVSFGTKSKANAAAESTILEEYHLVSSHAYTIRGYDSTTGLVSIVNPHSYAETTQIPVKVLEKYINHLDFVKL